MQQHLLARGKSQLCRLIEHLVVEMQSLGIEIENLGGDPQFVGKVSLALINNVSFNRVIRVACTAVYVIDADVLK